MKYRFKNACRWFNQAIHQPRRIPHETSYKEGAHEHLCLALRLLHYKVFKEICPNPGVDIEISDSCETCPFMCRIDYLPNHTVQIEVDLNNEQIISQNS